MSWLRDSMTQKNERSLTVQFAEEWEAGGLGGAGGVEGRAEDSVQQS